MSKKPVKPTPKRQAKSAPAGFPPRMNTKGVVLKGGVPRDFGKEPEQ